MREIYQEAEMRDTDNSILYTIYIYIYVLHDQEVLSFLYLATHISKIGKDFLDTRYLFEERMKNCYLARFKGQVEESCVIGAGAVSTLNFLQLYIQK